jgi:four helix bundle protein
MHDYKKLKIWKSSTEFAVLVYKATSTFPKEEVFGLTSQLRRAAVSIPSNIAEGSKRSTKKDFKSFLAIAHGSGAELETQLYISKEIGYLTEDVYAHLIAKLDEIMKMIAVFAKTLAT